MLLREATSGTRSEALQARREVLLRILVSYALAILVVLGQTRSCHHGHQLPQILT